MTSCLHVRHTLGVYVLGAIDPAERAAVDAHLAGCQDCREELASLAGLPALLGRVPMAEAERIAGPDQDSTPDPELADVELLTPLLARAAHQRRVNRWRGLAAAAAAVVVVAGAAVGLTQGLGHGQSGTAAAHWETARTTDTATHASLVVKYDGTAWGTRLDAQVTGIPAGTTCEFWVTGPDGKRWPAGSWTVSGTWPDDWYAAASAAPAGSVRGFEVTSGNTVLISMHAH